MNFPLVIIVLLPVNFAVVCGESGASEISSLFNFFPEFVKMNATHTQQTKRLRQQEILIAILKKDAATVAFSVRIAKDSYSSNNDRVIFTDVDLNEGGAFDVTNGHFRAPYSGLYQVSMDVVTEPMECAFFSIMKGGDPIEDLPIYNTGAAASSTGFSTVIKLREKENIYIVMRGHTCGFPGSIKPVKLRCQVSGFYIGLS